MVEIYYLDVKTSTVFNQIPDTNIMVLLNTLKLKKMVK